MYMITSFQNSSTSFVPVKELRHINWKHNLSHGTTALNQLLPSPKSLVPLTPIFLFIFIRTWLPTCVFLFCPQNKLIFTWQEGKEQTFDEFTDRIVRLNSSQRSFGRGSINITAIRETDSGWYECKVYFPNRSPISRNNGTWFHLTIDGEIHIIFKGISEF